MSTQPITSTHMVVVTLLRDMLTTPGRLDASVTWNNADWSSDDGDTEEDLFQMFRDYGQPEVITFYKR